MVLNHINCILPHTSSCNVFLLLRLWGSSMLIHIAVVLFQCCIVFHCMTLSQYIYLFSCWWAFRLLAVFHCDKQCCGKCSCPSPCVQAQEFLWRMYISLELPGFRGCVEDKIVDSLQHSPPPDVGALYDSWDGEYEGIAPLRLGHILQHTCL